MKKILCYLLICCMLPLYGICLKADNGTNCNFSLSFSPIGEDGLVTVSVHVTDNPGFCALKLLLRFDNTVLRPVPRSNKNNLYKGSLTINANSTGANLETMSQYSVVGSSTSTVSADGELFSFQMQVLPNAEAETLITCDAPSYVSTIDYASYDIVMDDTPLPLLYPQIAMPSENGEISLSQPYAAFGDEVTVDFMPNRTFMPDGFLLDGTPQEGNTYIAQGVHKVEGKFSSSPKFSLTVEPSDNGQVFVSSSDAYWGEEILLLTLPDEHYEISHFTVDGNPIEGDTLTVTDDHTVSAVFVPIVYPITIQETEGGTLILSADEGVFGTEITLTVTPDAHYTFTCFVVDDMLYPGDVLTVTGAHTICALFSPIRYDISTDTAEHGTVRADTVQGTFGQTVTLSCAPDEHYILEHFTLDGAPIDSNTFSISGHHTVGASFIPVIYTVTEKEALGGTFSVSAASGIFGAEITLTATPDMHYRFSHYLLDGEVLNENSFILSKDHTIQAVFLPILYDISIGYVEHGTVCADFSQGEFSKIVTLSATPDAHYTFGYYTVDGLPIDGSTFAVTGNHTVSAVFLPITYTVNAEESEGGTLSLSESSGIYGTQISITASPHEHYTLSHILLDGEIWEASTFTITKNHTVSAVFTPNLYDISIASTEHGSIAADQAQGKFGQTVTLSCTPDDHYILEHFTLDGAPLDGNTFSISGHHTVGASFVPAIYTVTAETVDGGTITLSESAGNFGTQITVTATPDADYLLKHILLDGEVLEGNSFTITKNHTVSALFEQENTVTVTVDIDGKGTVTGDGRFAVGTSVTLKATPASKYMFSAWYIDEKKVSTKKEYTFIAEKDTVVEAVFKKAGGSDSRGNSSSAQPTPVVPVPQTQGLRANANEIRFMTATNGQFMPERAATRYEVIEALDALFFVPQNTNPLSLSDVDSAHADIVARFSSAGILHGYTDGTFRGDNPITRAELCKVLCVILTLDTAKNSPVFTDVASDFWGSPYIAAIYEKGYVLGYEDQSFRPNNNVTRAELTALLSRIAGTKTAAPHPTLSDIDATHWAYETVLMACKHE